MNIGILGAGSWAIALSVLLFKRGHRVTMWEFNPADARMLGEKREHPQKLPGIIIPDAVAITNELHAAVAGSELIVCAVPSQTMRSTLSHIKKTASPAEIGAISGWVVVSKGIECKTLCLMTDILLQEVPNLTKDKVVVVSGPSHAEEVSRDIPTTVVAASENAALATVVQQSFSTETFRIYTNDDLTGVELAASVKNVIAIAAGICDGLGFGDNTKGALLTRGLVEMIRLGMKMGARQETFGGLAGMGDLITTCFSRHSRNRKFGEMIGTGLTVPEALERMVMVAEGVETTKSTFALAQKHGIDMPITEQVYLALFKGKSPRQAVRDLMMRQSKPERH